MFCLRDCSRFFQIKSHTSSRTHLDWFHSVLFWVYYYPFVALQISLILGVKVLLLICDGAWEN